MLQNGVSFHFMSAQEKSVNKTKIYEFLKKDQQLLQEMFAELDQVNQNDLLGDKKIRGWEIIKKHFSLRASQDVSHLPQDFQYAWERKMLSNIEWLNLVFDLKHTNKNGEIMISAEKEIAFEKMRELKLLTENLQNVAESYGVELDNFGNLK